MKDFVDVCNNSILAIGRNFYSATPDKKKTFKFRFFIYLSVVISIGKKVSDFDLGIVCPGFGIVPDFFDQIRVLRAVEEINACSLLKWDYFKSM